MDISIVVPTYNMSQLVKRTIEFTRHFALPDLELEIVVVDDGSGDDTQAVVQQARTPHALRYVHRPRDARSGRALARNLGIHAAAGDLLVFADSGVLLDPGFLTSALEIQKHDAMTVCIGEIKGIYAQPKEESVQVDSLEELHAFAKEGIYDMEWQDVRRPLFRQVGGELDRLPVPWSLGWTCLLSVPRAMALEIGGFDESFVGWGSEDCDFCYRLWQRRLQFRGIPGSSVHLPHRRSDAPAELARKEREDDENRYRLYAKRPSLEAEAYLAFRSYHDSLFLQRLKNLRLEYILPQNGRELLARVSNLLPAGPRLLVGPSTPFMAAALDAHMVSVINPDERAWFESELPGIRCVFSFGSRMPLPDQAVPVAVLGDFVRLFPREIQDAQLRELCRVSVQAFLVLTSDARHHPWSRHRREFLGWPQSTILEIEARARSLGVRWEVVREVDDVLVVRLGA
jgi:glycosyltransferase involved in cell wall biosynthesis